MKRELPVFEQNVRVMLYPVAEHDERSSRTAFDERDVGMPEHDGIAVPGEVSVSDFTE